MLSGFRLGSVSASKAASAVYDPAVLSLTGWWRANYAGSPWTATASAGGSGGNGSMTEATNPPATGSAQNGYTPADFDGTNDQLANANAMTTFLAAAAWSGWTLFLADTAAAAAADHRDNPALWDDSSLTYLGLHYSTDGVTVAQVGTAGGGTLYEVTVAASTGSYHLAQYKYDGTDLKLRVDSGAWSSLAATNIQDRSGTFRMGQSWLAAFFDGRVLEHAFASSALSDGTFDSVKSYVNSRYNLAL